jgi:hypothetical protein
MAFERHADIRTMPEDEHLAGLQSGGEDDRTSCLRGGGRSPGGDLKDRRKISIEEAETFLPEGDVVHTFRISDDKKIVGSDWSKKRVIERFRTNGVEFSGENARGMNHGLASFDEAMGWLFVETRRE